MDKKGILFDMGETLVHNIDLDFKRSIEYLYDINTNKNINKTKFVNESLNIIMDLLKSRTIIDFKAIDFIKLLKDTYNLEFNKTIETVEIEFAFKTTNYEIIDGVKELLEYFKNKNYQMIVLSNTCFSKKAIKKMLGSLSKYFTDILVSSEYLVRKPYKAFFDLGISKFTDILKSNLYYIGNDFYNDVNGAINSSIYPIWFNKTKQKIIPELKINDYIEITDYKQLIEMEF